MVVAMLVPAYPAVTAERDAAPALLIRNARVFDGTGAPASMESVLVVGERIVAVGRDLKIPRNARIIDARGLTLMPGMHDLHTHLRSPAYSAPEDLGKAYAGYLLRGVTTVNDFSVSAEMIAPIRAMTQQPGGLWAPNLNQAVRIGVPGGHGTENNWGEFFTLRATTPRAAHLAMKTALSYRPDTIKVFTDGWRYGRDADLNNMDVRTLSAVVEDARKTGIAVVTHTVTLNGAKVAASAGVASLVHGVGDTVVDDELIRLMKDRGTAYVPTMVVYEPQENRAFSSSEWGSLSPPEQSRESARMAKPLEDIAAYDSKRWSTLGENLRRLKAAGIPIGIGTDAGIGGVYHGPGAIREVVWLTKYGFTPAQALVAATQTSAAIMGQDKTHGTIAPGKRADLVLVGGKPDEAIEDIWNVRRVWVAGREVPLDALRARIGSAEATPMPVDVMTGPIDSGRRTDGRTDLDTLPVDSTDGGTDHSHIDILRPEGSATDARRIFTVAQLGAAPRPFAQLVLPLTRGAIRVADARAFTGIAFTVRGAGDYMLRLENYGLGGRDWFKAPFRAGATTTEVRIPFTSFINDKATGEVDRATLRALRFELSGKPGDQAWLDLGEVRFYRD
jgi:imidazolonepropionase-like amidohydrolase